MFTGEVSLTHIPGGGLLAGYKFWSRGGFPPRSLMLSRTSSPDARHQHDSDLVTFHRVADFRRLALDLHPAM